jgi:ribA/ribD-fused uncharacterized protein
VVTARVIREFEGPYECLSNFSSSLITFRGEHFWTAEHAFQAWKTLDPTEFKRIRDARGPGQAKRMGRQTQLRPDWEEIKLDVMRGIIAEKFAPGTKEAEVLLSTGDAAIVEGNSWHDNIWGICDCGRCPGVGLNWLGKILEEQRAALRGASGG